MKTRGGTIYHRITRSKPSNDGGETSLPIPIDLIFDIFSRLPAKSIARCRCVSKPWASILRRPDFTELFLTKSSARPQILISIVDDDELFLFSVPQVQNPNENSSIVTADYLKKFSVGYRAEMYGTVHGLVLLDHLRIFNEKREEVVPMVYNPSTGQCLYLPKLTTARTQGKSFLGYDHIDKKYKVLSLTWPYRPNTYGWISRKQKVLTVGAKKMSQRMVECEEHSSAGRGICIDGVLYYIPVQLDKPGYPIACFDVRSEKYRFVDIDEGMELRRDSTLVNYKEKLGVLLTHWNGVGKLTRESTCFELWVLGDSEKHEWTKHVYALPGSWKDLVGDAKLDFAGLTCANEVVLSPLYIPDGPDPFYVFYYSLERKTIKRVEIQGMDAFKDSYVHIFLNHVENVKLMQSF